ncbi:MAG: CopG family transcriptional regulator [Actinomycetota bacterium]
MARRKKEESDPKFTTVSIPTPLFEKIKKRIEGTGFTSVSSYVVYVLREILAEDSSTEEEAFTQEDEERVKERLRSLGYLD